MKTLPILNMNVYESIVFENKEDYIKNGGGFLKLTGSKYSLGRPLYRYYRQNILGYDDDNILHSNKSWLVYLLNDGRKVVRLD